MLKIIQSIILLLFVSSTARKTKDEAKRKKEPSQDIATEKGCNYQNGGLETEQRARADEHAQTLPTITSTRILREARPRCESEESCSWKWSENSCSKVCSERHEHKQHQQQRNSHGRRLASATPHTIGTVAASAARVTAASCEIAAE